MLKVRKAMERGQADHGWLKSFHTFSFADYYDPKHMAFRTLRVINEDFVAPTEGFPPHSHRDMEIITYVLDGELEHKDSMGNGSVIRPGEVQRMSAGTGVTHSEYNHSRSKPVHLLQIWILPEMKGAKPEYEQKKFSVEERKNKLRLIASREGENGSVTVHQNINLFAGILEPGKEATHHPGPERYLWLQVARGAVRLNGQALEQGDGVAITDEKVLNITGIQESEILLFDMG